MDVFQIGSLILNPVSGNFVVVSYDWTGRTATEIQRFTNSIAAAARAEAAGGYSAVVFDRDYKIPIYYNTGSSMQSVVAIGTSLEELGKFLFSGGFLNPPPNLEGIFKLAVEKGYCYDSAEAINKAAKSITDRINELFGG
jgi:hypothetical protein